MTSQSTTAIVKDEPLHLFMRKPEVIEKFIGLFPNDQAANRYIQSVIILVQSADPGEYSLATCSNESVLKSALRAASLRVSVDPAVRQAWMVPRKNRKNGKLEANLQLHYMEIKNRAMRTNRYRCINISPVYEGSTVMEDIYSGLNLVRLASGLMTTPDNTDRFVPVSERRGKIIGWLGYMETIRGAKQTVYMSISDIEMHTAKYNPYWTTSKAWLQNRQTMEQKTVLLALLRKADLGDTALDEIREIVSEGEAHDDETIDAEFASELERTTEPETPSTAPNGGSPPPENWDASWSAAQAAQAAQAAPAVATPPPPAPEPALVRPYPPELFKEKFEAATAVILEKNHLEGVGAREQQIIASALDSIFSGEKTVRYEVCKWLTGHASTKEMSKAQLKALLVVMGVSDYNQPPKSEFMTEIKAAHAHALRAAGQQDLFGFGPAQP